MLVGMILLFIVIVLSSAYVGAIVAIGNAYDEMCKEDR